MQLIRRYEIRRSPEWVVWRAEQAGSRQLFLVKEIATPTPAAGGLLNRLRAEYDFFTSLDHPHLLRAERLDLAGRRILFEDAQCSLAQHLGEHGPLAPTLVANVLLQCADALEYLHDQQKGHGAIGPHTLLVGPGGEVKLGDFLGYTFGSAAALPALEGEPKYQAPELIDSSFGVCSPASDLYCLGYAALELLTGDQLVQLFGIDEGCNWLAWHADPARQLTDWRGALYHVPAGLLDVIAGLIEKDPARRLYRSASQLRADLLRSRLTSDQRIPPFRPAGSVAPVAPGRPGLAYPDPRPSCQGPPLAVQPAAGGPVRWFGTKRPLFVGRARQCDLRLQDPSASRKHALLLCQPDGHWWVHDLGSLEGTWVNGVRVPLAVLHDGDEVTFGGETCRVRLGGPGAGPYPVVGGFELREKLHEGANGRLFRAAWLARGGREVAVRVYPQEFQLDEVSIKRFLRGNPGAGRLRHPNVVRLHRGGVLRRRTGNVWFLAMEYLPGGSLRDRLASHGPLPLADAVRFALDIANALTPAAERGLVHRNINPSCVLFDGAGVAKLGDFSLLRGAAPVPLQEITQAALPPGEHAYQPPEQLLGVPDLSPACDLYSLGATLYEALTGQPPFGRDLPWMDLVRSVCGRPVRPARELNPSIPPALDALLLRALDKSAERRFATPEEFHSALQAAAGQGAG